MPSAIPRRDVSTTWRPHRCGAVHLDTVPCPRPGYWLVAGTPVGDPYPLALLGTRAKRVTP